MRYTNTVLLHIGQATNFSCSALASSCGLRSMTSILNFFERPSLSEIDFSLRLLAPCIQSRSSIFFCFQFYLFVCVTWGYSGTGQIYTKNVVPAQLIQCTDSKKKHFYLILRLYNWQQLCGNVRLFLFQRKLLFCLFFNNKVQITNDSYHLSQCTQL